MAQTIAFISLGCPKNQVDAEIMMNTLKEGGYNITGDLSKCDAVIINTCGFIQSAKEESINEILEVALLKKEGTIKKIIVTGCMAERYREDILRDMPEVDAVVGIGSNKDICDIVRRTLGGNRVDEYDKKEKLPIEGGRVLTTLPYYAYLKIAEGCDNRCSYCAIPYIRGRFRSRKIEDIVKEAESLARDGVKELVVVAQDTTRYGEDIYGEYSLARLLKELCKIEGIRWIRTLYNYPDKITDELLETVAENEKLVKYFDIPIQHCNKEVLRRMNRPMDKESLTALFKKIRQRVNGVTLRTTLIAGFPGETDKQFEELCEFIDEIQFDRLGCFAYSAEEGTPAAEMDDQIDEDIKQKRADIINEQQSIIMEQKNKALIGKKITVVIEGFDKYGECYFGRSEADAPEIDGKIFITTDKRFTMGDFVTVTVNDVMECDLVANA